MMSNQLIEKAIKDGHVIVDKIRAAKSVEEIDAMMPEVENYADFVDKNFGEMDEWNEEKECELTTFLYVMIDWAKKALQPENKNFQPAHRQFLICEQQFEEFLDSKSWIP